MPTVFAIDKVLYHATSQRAGTIEGDDGDEILKTAGLHFSQYPAQTVTFQLEDADGIFILQKLVNFRCIQRQIIDIQFNLACLADNGQGPIDHCQGSEP